MVEEVVSTPVAQLQAEVADLIKAMMTVKPRPSLFVKAKILAEDLKEPIPKSWWVNCVSRAKDFAEDAEAFCLQVWAKPGSFLGKAEGRDALGVDRVSLGGIMVESPPRLWWDSALKIAKADVPGLRNPVAFCGFVWYSGSDGQRKELGREALEKYR